LVCWLGALDKYLIMKSAACFQNRCRSTYPVFGPSQRKSLIKLDVGAVG
jgi:hypothetical protein